MLDSILGSAPDLAPIEGTDRRGWIEWVVQGSADLFARPDVRAALPGLIGALRDHEDLRNTLWRNFSGPSTALFSDGSSRADLDARAVLVLAAGAAMFASIVAAEDDTAPLRARILDLLIPVADD